MLFLEQGENNTGLFSYSECMMDEMSEIILQAADV